MLQSIVARDYAEGILCIKVLLVFSRIHVRRKEKLQMKLLLSIALLIAPSFQADAPIFEIDLWPGEGRPIFEPKTKSLGLRELPSASSKLIVTVTIPLGQRLPFDDTRFRTTQIGKIRVIASAQVRGRNLGTIGRLSREDYYKGKFAPALVELKPGATIEYLQYRAEDTCFVRIGENVIDAEPCPANDKSKFRVEIEPKTEWWIHSVLSDGSKGWVLVTDSAVKLLKREY